MRVSKNQVTLLSAAVAALFAASSAQAQIILASSNPTVAAVNGSLYARELAAGTQLSPAGMTVNTILGVGMSTGQNRYVKFTLTNATFNSAVAAGNLTVGNATTIVSFGGAAASNSVIFQLTSTTPGTLINDAVSFNMTTGVNITSTASAATVSYEVYEFLNQAQAGTPVLYARSASAAGFQNAVNLTSAAAQNTTATAASSYLNVSGGSAEAATRARIARLALALPTTLTTGFTLCTATICLANNTAATVGAIVNGASTSNTLALTGDFGAATSAASINTPTATEVASAVTATTATLPLLAGTVGATGFAALDVRYTVNGTTALPVSAYTAAFTGVAQTGYTLSTLGPVTSGNIFRDGVQFDTPWVTATPGFISRFFLTQTTPATVPYTVTVRNAAGLVTGGAAGGTLASNRQTLITLASLLPADTTAFPGPYQVTFNVAATNTAVQGTYALTSPTGTVAVQRLYTLALQ